MNRFEIIVVGESNDYDETVRGIRALLKRLGRTYRLRCVTCRPIPTAQEKSDAATSLNGMQKQTIKELK